jgi:hypothetical protein
MSQNEHFTGTSVYFVDTSNGAYDVNGYFASMLQ